MRPSCLDRLLGFAGEGSALSGAVVRSGLPVRIGAAASAFGSNNLVWMAEVIAPFPLAITEERKAIEAYHKILAKSAWKELLDTGGSSVLELLRTCLLRSRGAESVIFRRNPAFLTEGRFAAARLSGAIPKSVLNVFEVQNGSSEQRLARYLENYLSKLACVESYNVQYEGFKYCTDTAIERVRTLYPQAVAAAALAASRIGSLETQIDTSKSDQSNSEMIMMVQDALTRAVKSRKDCLGWWQLAADEWAQCRAGCPHGVLGDACLEKSCSELRDIACDTSLCAWAASETEVTQTRLGPDAGDQNHSHVEARAAGLDLGLESLGQLALTRLYDSVRAYSPCQLLLHSDLQSRVAKGTSSRSEDKCSTGLIDRRAPFHLAENTEGPEGAIFNSHILQRARQAHMSAALAADFCRPHGHSRDRALIELDRMTSGPASARPPVVILSGPLHSGRTSTLATCARLAARPAAVRTAEQRHPFDALPSIRGAGPVGSADVVAFYQADSDCLSAEMGESNHNNLCAAIDYLTTEISLQLEGHSALNGEVDCATFTQYLLCTSSEEQLKYAEARLATVCRTALKAGARLLLLVDGLSQASVLRLGRLMLLLHGETVRARYFAHRNSRETAWEENISYNVEGCGGIQCVLTGETPPKELRADVREVSLEPLSLLEREIICWHWLRRFGLDAGGKIGVDSFDSSFIATV